jgi:hypothetical protein
VPRETPARAATSLMLTGVSATGSSCPVILVRPAATRQPAAR